MVAFTKHLHIVSVGIGHIDIGIINGDAAGILKPTVSTASAPKLRHERVGCIGVTVTILIRATCNRYDYNIDYQSYYQSSFHNVISCRNILYILLYKYTWYTNSNDLSSESASRQRDLVRGQ